MEVKPLVAAIKAALRGLRAVAADAATEHSYRTPIEALLQAAAAECAPAAQVRQEPRREEGGAPDFKIFTAAGTIGYVEHKKPGTDLDAVIQSEQLVRYRKLSDNLLLTDGLRWMRLRGGDIVGDARVISSPEDSARPENIEQAALLLRDFISHQIEPIGAAEELAKALALRCANLRDFLRETIKRGGGAALAVKLRGVLSDFRKEIFRDLEEDVFADAFAQTLVYGLFLARLIRPAGEKIELAKIDRAIPPSLPLLRGLSGFLRDLDDDENKKAHWIVRDLADIINRMDLAAIKESLSFSGGKDDPYIYFYEEFLKEYNPQLRRRRGVYYTPPPVVQFIVGAVESLLQNEFGIARRFADSEQVTVLDFAAGTGTFMVEVMRRALNAADSGARDSLIREHILKNIYGFEYLIAPYAVAHLKVSQFLRGEGYELSGNESAQIYLTNALAPVGKQVDMPYLPALAREARNAQRVKDNPVLVITGNPPYSGVSQNKGEWITNLIEDYKRVDGAHFGERKHWLQDDYVKFIRFAQWKMESVDRGIVAVITNHAFLDNPTFRGMRQSLLKTFNRLYFLDLHGNSKKQERAPDGGKDENVFDIQQGVAISIMVKAPRMRRAVYHAGLWGTRAHKYKRCAELGLKAVKWNGLAPESPFYLFVPQKQTAKRRYDKGVSLADIFGIAVTGVVTARDQFAVDFTGDELLRKMRQFADLATPDDLVAERFNLKNTRGWNLSAAREEIAALKKRAQFVKRIAYRPFDERVVFYHRAAIDWGRWKLLRHMTAGDGNIGLISVRQVAETDFNHIFVSDLMAESRMTLSNKGICYVFPLYRYLENGELNGGGYAKCENISPEFRRALEAAIGFRPKAEDILGYVYAILHAPAYRKKYADFLRYDFPRIPTPPNAAAFRALAKIGGKLIAAHLLVKPGRPATRFVGGGDDKVLNVRYAEKDKRLYINPGKYFAPLSPQVWEFQIGGYLPLKKYLQARKGRILSLAEINRVCAAAAAIGFTIAQMEMIDKTAAWI